MCSSIMIHIHCHVTLISTLNHCKLANKMCTTKYYTVVPLRLSFMPVLDLYVIFISVWVFVTLFWFLFEFSVTRLDMYISWHLMLPNHFSSTCCPLHILTLTQLWQDFGHIYLLTINKTFYAYRLVIHFIYIVYGHIPNKIVISMRRNIQRKMLYC